MPGKKSKLEPTCLLDANVLLALAWPNHPFHHKSRDWFARQGSAGWGTCLLTEAAFVRLSANPVQPVSLQVSYGEPGGRFLPPATAGVLAPAGSHEAAWPAFISLRCQVAS